MYHRILIPIDGSATSDRGLDEAIKLALLTRAKLRLIHVVDDLRYVTGFETYAAYATDVVPLMRTAGEKLLVEGKDRIVRAGLNADTVLINGLAPSLARVVAEQVESWGADLIVIGTHGRRGASRLLLGSDAEQVVRTAAVPVLLVRCVAKGAGPAAAVETHAARTTASADQAAA